MKGTFSPLKHSRTEKLTLDEYLDLVVFYERRLFSRAKFRSFMFAQSKACPGMSELIAQLKVRHGLKIIAVSNEARELNAYRIRTFKLNKPRRCIRLSCFVQFGSRTRPFFRLALDIAQTPIRRFSISTTRPCSSRSRKLWGFRAFFTQITNTRTNELFD